MNNIKKLIKEAEELLKETRDVLSRSKERTKLIEDDMKQLEIKANKNMEKLRRLL